MNKKVDQLHIEIINRRIAVLKDYDEAREIQQQCRLLPFAERSATMNEVSTIQKRAVSESRQIAMLEQELILFEREDIKDCKSAIKKADNSISKSGSRRRGIF